MRKKAFITGITGQDGSYLAEFLLEKGYEVHGLVRRRKRFNLNEEIILHYGDMTDQSSIIYALSQIEPDEIYNLAAQSHVKVSFEEPEYTANSDALGPLRVLEAIRILGLEKKTKFYQASTSELFGGINEVPQSENTPFYPRSPYAVAKLYAYWITVNYREAYGIFACNGILFNHESPRRGENFVTRKITLGVSRIYYGLQDHIILGNLDARRDWGYAPDYVEAMWLMLQQGDPYDYVIATGETHSVREFVEKAFEYVGIDIVWKGKGVDEVGIDRDSGRVLVKVDPRYFRPDGSRILQGDYSKAKKKLGWEPKVRFEKLVEIMMDHDLEYVKRRC